MLAEQRQALGRVLTPHLRLTLERDAMLSMMLDPNDDASSDADDSDDDELPTGDARWAAAQGAKAQAAEPARPGGPRRVQFKTALSSSPADTTGSSSSMGCSHQYRWGVEPRRRAPPLHSFRIGRLATHVAIVARRT